MNIVLWRDNVLEVKYSYKAFKVYKMISLPNTDKYSIMIKNDFPIKLVKENNSYSIHDEWTKEIYHFTKEELILGCNI